MLPADAILRAAARWLRLLDRSTLPQAAALIRSDSQYADLSTTQYAAALDWLRDIGVLEDAAAGSRLTAGVRGLSEAQIGELLFARSLEAAPPAWLQDADVLVRDQADLPEDAAALAQTLGIGDGAALLGVRQVHGHIDLEQRAAVGAAGERELIALLEERWPGSTYHVAADHDGFGYDVALTTPDGSWHLEVKATTRRGRLVIHVSRQEHEVGLQDSAWRLVVVGLNERGSLACLATLRSELLPQRAPRDLAGGGRWESARYEISPGDLTAGLPFIPALVEPDNERSPVATGRADDSEPFLWMPVQ